MDRQGVSLEGTRTDKTLGGTVTVADIVEHYQTLQGVRLLGFGKALFGEVLDLVLRGGWKGEGEDKGENEVSGFFDEYPDGVAFDLRNFTSRVQNAIRKVGIRFEVEEFSGRNAFVRISYSDLARISGIEMGTTKKSAVEEKPRERVHGGMSETRRRVTGCVE
ncbi:MAG: hypothetical protein WC651_01465 [Candidatus Gracilibacteria bacterium]|jgi:hypothetical protein